MSGERRKEAWGRTAAFVADVIAAAGTAYAASWLSSVNCAFTVDTIFTTGLGRERILKDHYALAYKHRIRIRQCPIVTARFYAHVDKKPTPPPQPDALPSYFPDDGQAEFRRLARARLLESGCRPGFADVVFHPASIKYRTDGVIVVRAPIYAQRLNDVCADLLERFGLNVEFKAAAFEGEPPIPSEEITDAERAQLVTLLRGHAASIRGSAHKHYLRQRSQLINLARAELPGEGHQ